MLEFLTGEFAQKLYGKINYEYPVNPNIGLSSALNTWGVFKEDTVSIEKIAELARESQKIIDRSGW